MLCTAAVQAVLDPLLLPPLPIVNTQDLQEYLTGRSDRSEYIQLTVPDLEVGGACRIAALEPFGTAAASAGASGRTSPGLIVCCYLAILPCCCLRVFAGPARSQACALR